ncbi:cardiolipin synthase [Pseudoruegeria sp. HB172150]|uniref:cardiolipin synthase n=1 Tax=Pseudoruegeria sp. HB172150 TaxID=2721164 RepID=UPI001554DD0A|nr:cardiolipin synthase [Pseudoruegeria sp. HB172150]
MLTQLGPIFAVLYVAAALSFILRALLREGREPASRIAWVMVIFNIPLLGMVLYTLFGETNIGRGRVARYKETKRLLADLVAQRREAGWDLVEERHLHLFRTGRSISGFAPVGGNTATLLSDAQAEIDAIIADMDAAQDHVHLLFYIWLEDATGLRIAEAAIRAAQRGVTVRAMADGLGSRNLIGSRHWVAMGKAGVQLVEALPIGNPLLHPIRGRIDLRNHRKIIVIDNRITYCGSRNCADPEFLPKAKYGPWIDLMLRFEGPVAMQNQALFAQDWLSHVEEPLPETPPDVSAATDGPGIVAQAIGTGPTVRDSAMPEVFVALLHGANRDLTVTTPYYVPNEAIQTALCAAAQRGVNTRMVMPERNDSWVVAAASHSYYLELLQSGVRIFEYPHGLLHTKLLTLDDSVALVGSANLDRRSFELNYENNILLQDAELTAGLRARQEDYIAASREILLEEVRDWSVYRRLWNNTVAMMGPVL